MILNEFSFSDCFWSFVAHVSLQEGLDLLFLSVWYFRWWNVRSVDAWKVETITTCQEKIAESFYYIWNEMLLYSSSTVQWSNTIQFFFFFFLINFLFGAISGIINFNLQKLEEKIRDKCTFIKTSKLNKYW